MALLYQQFRCYHRNPDKGVECREHKGAIHPEVPCRKPCKGDEEEHARYRRVGRPSALALGSKAASKHETHSNQGKERHRPHNEMPHAVPAQRVGVRWRSWRKAQAPISPAPKIAISRGPHVPPRLPRRTCPIPMAHAMNSRPVRRKLLI